MSSRTFLLGYLLLCLFSACDRGPAEMPAGHFLQIGERSDLYFLQDSLGARLKKLQSAGDSQGSDYALTLRNLALVHEHLGHIRVSEHFYRRSLDQFNERKSNTASDADNKLRILREYLQFSRSRDLPVSAAYHADFIRLSSALPRPPYSELQYHLVFLSDLYRSIGQPDYALYYLQWAQQITLQSPFPLDISSSTLGYELATLFYLQKDHSSCRTTVEELLQRKDLTETEALRAEILAAKNARAQKAVLRSLEHYNRALEQEAVNDIYRDIILFGRGEIHFILRHFPEAETDLLSSLDLALTLYGADSRSVKRRTDLLEKVYDFSKQYDKLKMLRNSLQR